MKEGALAEMMQNNWKQIIQKMFGVSKGKDLKKC